MLDESVKGKIISVEKSLCGTYHMVLCFCDRRGFMDWVASSILKKSFGVASPRSGCIGW